MHLNLVIYWIRWPTKQILNPKFSIFSRSLWPAFIWGILILILIGTPGEHIPEFKSFWDWIGFDKFVHIFIFAPLSFLILFGLRQQYLNSKRRYLYVLGALGISLAYGLLTEVLQAYVFIGRDGNVFDFIADSLGAFVGLLGFILIYGKKIKKYSKTK